MLLTEQFALVLLALLLGAQLLLRSRFFFRHSHLRLRYSLLATRYSLAAALLGIFSILAYWTFAQYLAWAVHPISKHLLPPEQPISYFIAYIGSRLIFPAFIALFAAGIAWYAMRAANRRFDERFFEAEEPLLAATAIFLVGYPSFLLYIPLVLLFGACLSLVYRLLGNDRAPLYFLWIPLALVVILISYLYLPPSFENFFRL